MQTFLCDLDARDELARVARPVDPCHQLAAVTRAVRRAGEQAVLFENVAGASMPVVSNLYGSHERLCRPIGAGERSFCERWIELRDACLAIQDADMLVPATAQRAGALSPAACRTCWRLPDMGATAGRISPRRSFWRANPTTACRTCPSAARCRSATASCGCGGAAATT